MNEPSPTRAAIDHLLRCREARAAGYPVHLTTDPRWLLNVAINRRAGWPDDPSFERGSAMPVGGRFPAKAGGDYYRHLVLAARAVNEPRRIVRLPELGEHRWLAGRIPGRFFEGEA